MTSWQHTSYTGPLFITEEISAFQTLMILLRRRFAEIFPFFRFSLPVNLQPFSYVAKFINKDRDNITLFLIFELTLQKSYLPVLKRI